VSLRRLNPFFAYRGEIAKRADVRYAFQKEESNRKVTTSIYGKAASRPASGETFTKT
jgi:hypothetical protein